MRDLINLVETEEVVDTQFDISNLKHQRDQIRQSRSQENLSGGFFSHGQLTNPWEFEKQDFLPSDPKINAQYQFFKQVYEINPGVLNNPYLPLIYNIKIERDSSGQQRPIYTMRSLISHERIPVIGLFMVYRRLFESDTDPSDSDQQQYKWINGLLQDYLEDKNLDSEYELRFTCLQEIWQMIVFIFDGRKSSRDQNLMEAIDLIRSIIDQNPDSFSHDLEMDNFMFAAMGSTYQLVITDPIVSSDQVRMLR